VEKLGQIKGSGSSFVKPAELCSYGPVAAYYPHDAAAASGVLVPGTVTVYPAYRTNRVSILDAIDQPSASRNLSQNQIIRQFTAPANADGFRRCNHVRLTGSARAAPCCCRLFLLHR